MEPPVSINDILEGTLCRDPFIKMVGGVRLATLVLDCLSCQVHPLRDGRGVMVYWDGPLIQAVNAKVELREMDESAWPDG